jgi:predicted NUDIX family phosphoesterase
MKLENKTVWIRLFEKYYEETKADLVIDDCRFLDEAAIIKKNGGYIIRVINENNKSVQSVHISALENKKIKPDFIIHNNSSIADLEVKINEVLKMIKLGFADIGATIYL